MGSEAPNTTGELGDYSSLLEHLPFHEYIAPYRELIFRKAGELVGKDTQMPDLLILLGTLGGIAMFGVIGFIIGPIIAALFITIWEIYGEVFRDVLPEGEKEPPAPQPGVGKGEPLSKGAIDLEP